VLQFQIGTKTDGVGEHTGDIFSAPVRILKTVAQQRPALAVGAQNKGTQFR
jgi:hypothetical protein